MGNFEKLSVLVIVVIIVMILVVALYTWTDDPASKEVSSQPNENALDLPDTRDPSGNTTRTEGSAPWSEWADFPRTEPQPGEQPDRPVVTPELEPIGPRADSPGTERPPSEEPAPEPAVPAPVAPKERTYVIKPGDSYGLIAQRELGSYKYWPEIEKLNGIPPRRLREGMTIRLPAVGTGGAPVSSGAALASGPGPKPGTTYTLRRGEDIHKVAELAYGSRDRWMDIWLENLQKLDEPADAREGVSLMLPPR